MKFLFDLNDDDKRRLWILTDEPLVKVQWARIYTPWFVVLAISMSPREAESSGRWENERNSGVRYMRNWEWHEIFAAFRYFPSFRLGDYTC